MITGSVHLSLSPPLKTWGAIGQIPYLERLLCTIWEFWINQGLSRGERCSYSAHCGKVFSMRSDLNVDFQLVKGPSRCEVRNWRCSKDTEGRGHHRHREGRLWGNCSGWVMRRGTWLIHRKLEISISFSQNHLHYFSVGCQCFLDNALCRPEQHRKEITAFLDLLLFSFLSAKLFAASFSTASLQSSLSAWGTLHFSPMSFCLIL